MKLKSVIEYLSPPTSTPPSYTAVAHSAFYVLLGLLQTLYKLDYFIEKCINEINLIIIHTKYTFVVEQ